jgi:hypothetical protein
MNNKKKEEKDATFSQLVVKEKKKYNNQHMASGSTIGSLNFRTNNKWSCVFFSLSHSVSRPSQLVTNQCKKQQLFRTISLDLLGDDVCPYICTLMILASSFLFFIE